MYVLQQKVETLSDFLRTTEFISVSIQVKQYVKRVVKV